MKRPKAVVSRLDVAYHEAGRAVVGLALGSHPGLATIIATEGAEGRVVERGHSLRVRQTRQFGYVWDDPRVLHRLLNDATVLLAGVVAQAYKSRRKRNRASDASDLRQTEHDLLGHVVPVWRVGEYRALVKWLRLRSRRLVIKHWAAIDAVAKELLAKGSLSGQEIRGIVVRIEPDAFPDPPMTAALRREAEIEAAQILNAYGEDVLNVAGREETRIMRSCT